ncbi:MAG: ATP phosphoribosyltransferase regulatory subunit [Ectothiorhodospiraceae bacterium]|jgi:ATP phosphoribosyltransferase regulatory subunit|nr:ATP phosphoribosyltransferase regulatory subunit [Ectothiorhodospiraceae bacterium]
MTQQNRWLLPEGIEEALPELADRLEHYRRRLLDLYRGWGYELVMPPLIEYVESLLTGTGHDLDLNTFKLIDQLNGRLMGVRADMTPQVARIDAHRLRRDTPSRLCYMGTVLHTRPDGFAGSRSPLQVGAELYGHAGVESDVEVLQLMLETFAACGIPTVHVDLGHVAVYRGLARQAGLDAAQEAAFFELLQRKALPEITAFVDALGLEPAMSGMLRALATLSGGDDTPAEAHRMLAAAGPDVHAAIDYVATVAEALRRSHPAAEIHFDLSELRGYHYQTGVVFAAYVPGEGQEIARGGRYDEIGRVFGRARPATGFSTDLKTLVRLSRDVAPTSSGGIFAPAAEGAALESLVRELRVAGERVIRGFAGQDAAAARAMGCDRIIDNVSGQWTVRGM